LGVVMGAIFLQPPLFKIPGFSPEILKLSGGSTNQLDFGT